MGKSDKNWKFTSNMKNKEIRFPMKFEKVAYL